MFRTKSWLGRISLILLLSACSEVPVAPDSPPVSSKGAPLPADVARSLLPPVSVALPRRDNDANRRFDIEVSDLDAKTFFVSLVEGTPFSAVVNPRVSGNVSISMKNATLAEIMDAVRDSYGYDYRLVGQRYTILPAELQTRNFQVNYLNLTRKGKSRTRVTSGQITDSVGSTGTSGSSATGGGATGQTGSEGQRGVVGSNIETESSSLFWEDLERSLKLMVGSGEGEQLALNPDAGIITVRAFPSKLREIESYLLMLHGNVHRQVILETKIIEVTLSEGFQAGINWAQLATPGSDGRLLAGNVGGQNAISSGASSLGGSALALVPGATPPGASAAAVAAGTALGVAAGNAAPITSLGTTAFGGGAVLALTLRNFAAAIELLQTQGDVQVLSSPRISTVNNQKAIIKVGSDEFFVTGVSSNTAAAAGAAATSSSNIQIQPFFSGIALDVTPRIYGPGEVILHVHPTISEVREQPKTLVVDGRAQQLPLAFSSLRETDSIIRARSGQIVVIGGLMQTRLVDQDFGTPVLSKVPLIGNLFKQQRQSAVKSELVVLMKPIVVDDEDQWGEQLGEIQQRTPTGGPNFLRTDSWMGR